MRKFFELNLLPEEIINEDTLRIIVSKRVGIKLNTIKQATIIKKSIDARKDPITYRVKLALDIIENGNSDDLPERKQEIHYNDVSNGERVIVIGAGPCGLFASLKLIALGFKPIILERGKKIEERKKDIASIFKDKTIDEESNFSFGEGGAGTFSDGKLYTRSNKRGSIEEVLDIFINHGADKEIKVDAHPHIGTDKLSTIIKNIRKTIISSNGEYHFNTKVVDLIVRNNRIKGVITQNGDRIEANYVVLATGHSARDIFYLFNSKKWLIEKKPFAMGVRVEHPQEIINKIQYHSKNYSPLLPAASYNLTYTYKNRGVFSFCMCPGGMIIPASTQKGLSLVNGMSNSLRNSPFANSGIVVSILEEDALEYSDYGELALMKLQEDLEKKIYNITSNETSAPIQRLSDFLKNKKSSSFAETSYLCDLVSVNFNNILPKNITNNLIGAFRNFDQKMKGFISPEANIIGLESRTSSPVRILRDNESLEHKQISGLYPCGEGSGYAGGITSSCIDGIRVAQKISETCNKIF
ncbi:MAG: FAD-dependent oxidoreductase [Bacteroidales bacterium]|jgi:uncharacterized FAD-dependent dehydrogenase|nr:FAD-dependent oxidoreductase [Bacteroidales bacterium]